MLANLLSINLTHVRNEKKEEIAGDFSTGREFKSHPRHLPSISLDKKKDRKYSGIYVLVARRPFDLEVANTVPYFSLEIIIRATKTSLKGLH